MINNIAYPFIACNMSHWIETYMTKDEFEQHISDGWGEPNYKDDEGPIEIENKTDPSLKIALVNTRSTAGTNRISLEHETDGGVEELETQRYGLDRQEFANIIEWLEHFCENSQNYL